MGELTFMEVWLVVGALKSYRGRLSRPQGKEQSKEYEQIELQIDLLLEKFEGWQVNIKTDSAGKH